MSDRGVCFGSSQERRLFPLHRAADRLGNHMPKQGLPHVGPGSYDNHEFGTILYGIQKTPGSKKGYSLSARTAVRFPPCNKLNPLLGHHILYSNIKMVMTATPSPWQYQQDQSGSMVVSPGKTPFNSTTQRFKRIPCTSEGSPGPGAYAHDAGTNRKVSWPMCFGRPDWSRLPQAEKKSLRVKLSSEKEQVKQRNRVAYLSLYY